MQQNERTYRQLNRIVDERKPYARTRAVLTVCLIIAGSALFWLFWLGFIFGVSTGPGILR